MRVAALLLAVSAAVAWGVGSVLVKRASDVVSPTTILVFQYVLGVALVGGRIAFSGGASAAFGAVGGRWPALIAISLVQVAGYVCFIVAIGRAGEGSIPTSAAVAIAASYPALVAVLSGPFLGESLAWNHVAGIALVISGVILSQL